MSTISITYKFIDGAHFFVSSDKDAEGLCVAHTDLKLAYEEVAKQLDALFAFNHGQKTKFKPSVPFEDFQKGIEASTLVLKLADRAGNMVPASIQPWMYDKPGVHQ